MDPYLLLSFVIFGAALAVSFRSLRRRGRINPFYALFAGAFIAITLLILPAMGALSFNAVLTALHTAIRVFVADGGLESVPPSADALYYGWSAALFILAPVLTFGFVLSFFKNLMARFKLRLLGLFRKKWYIFSHLGEKSVAFAKSIPPGEKALLVFAETEGADEALIGEAEELGAVLLGGTEFHHISPKKNTEAFFFAIGEDPHKNLALAVDVIERYESRPNTRLYAFTPDEAAELVLDSALLSSSVIIVRRVDPELSLVHRTLYEQSIFENAVPDEDGTKLISAVVLGLGGIGAQLTKALCWCGQMEGYKISVTAFDRSAEAADRFAAECPSLIRHSGEGGDDEDRYTLTLHGGVDFTGSAFQQLVRPASLVFVAMGSDHDNIAAALEARAVFERMGCMPRIFAFVWDSSNAGLLRRRELRNFKGQDYSIKFLGDLSEQYSFQNILSSELERDALAVHLASGTPEEYFYRYDYCYQSSAASAIHAKWTSALGLFPSPIVEHRRWNAYMRSIGYRYAPVRSDRAKIHTAMLPYHALPTEEQRKDITITESENGETRAT